MTEQEYIPKDKKAQDFEKDFRQKVEKLAAKMDDLKERASNKQFKFTQASLDRLKPRETDYIVRDTVIAGLQCRVGKTGVKTLSIKKRIRGGTPRLVKVCRLGELPLSGKQGETVVTRCQKILADLSGGIEPSLKESKGYDPTLKQAYEFYIAEKTNTRKGKIVGLSKSAKKIYLASLNNHLASWKKRRISTIRPDEIKKKFASMSDHPSTANKTFIMLSSVYKLNYQHSYDRREEVPLPPNPVNLTYHPDNPRENIIEPEDMPIWWEVVESLDLGYDKVRRRGDVYRDYLQLMLFTGLRREEAIGLLWANVDLEGRTLTVLDTKNGTDLTLPITNFVHKMLKRRLKYSSTETVFDDMKNPDHAMIWLNKKFKERFPKAIRDEKYFTIHDIRRTFSNYAEDIDISDKYVETILNQTGHGSVRKKHYLKANVERLRKPLQKIENHTLRLARKIKGKIVEMQFK